ncbi:MAG: 2-oxo acid dehydrogenase subunit E2 [Oscillospiraceae bacterium]|nr:2-oxo acid dehydrogenase subunit E2 [Oscillospiraceae bacterium]
MEEGTIEEWKMKVGDTVKKGDILFSVATDKLTNDIEAEDDGVLISILVGEGETVPCKTVIGYLGAAGEQAPAGGAAAAPVAAPAAPAAAPAAAAPVTAAAPVARPVGEYVLATPYAKKLASDKGYDLAAIAATGYNGVIVARDVEAHVAGPHIKASPVAAKMAAELGVDLASIGTDGQRIMKADVQAAVAPAAAPAAAAAPVAAADEDEVIKVTPMRRAIAKNMENSWHTSPRVTFTRPFDATGMKDLRKALNKSLEPKGIKVSYNHIIMKVVSMVLRDYPDINGSFADNKLIHHKHINMGLAVAQPSGGLVVPNVKDCDKKSLAEIAVEADKLAKDGKAGKLGMDAMSGGTFTITNLGNYGLTNFSPIINQPELAILGVCDMVDTPVVRDGQIVIRPMMNLSLTADHRVVDGVMASKFLKRIAELLENPYMLLV